jgi:hypothetical protein
MAVGFFKIGERVKLRVKRYALEAGARGTVQFIFESVAGYMIVFDGETSERFVWHKILDQGDEEASTEC